MFPKALFFLLEVTEISWERACPLVDTPVIDLLLVITIHPAVTFLHNMASLHSLMFMNITFPTGMLNNFPVEFPLEEPACPPTLRSERARTCCPFIHKSPFFISALPDSLRPTHVQGKMSSMKGVDPMHRSVRNNKIWSYILKKSEHMKMYSNNNDSIFKNTHHIYWQPSHWIWRMWFQPFLHHLVGRIVGDTQPGRSQWQTTWWHWRRPPEEDPAILSRLLKIILQLTVLMFRLSTQ